MITFQGDLSHSPRSLSYEPLLCTCNLIQLQLHHRPAALLTSSIKKSILSFYMMNRHYYLSDGDLTFNE